MSLNRRYQALVIALATAEPGDLVAQEVEPLKRGFRQLADEAYTLWAARSPERAKTGGAAAFTQMHQLLRRGGSVDSLAPTLPRPHPATIASWTRPTLILVTWRGRTRDQPDVKCEGWR